MTIRIWLADDHRLVRETVRAALAAEPGITVVGESGTAQATLSGIGDVGPDVLLLDIGLPDVSGIEVARQALKRWPSLRIVAVSAHGDAFYVQETLKAGVHGYVVKSAGIADMMAAIHAVAGGGSYLSPEVAHVMVRRLHTDADLGTASSVRLGNRESQVLRLLAEGKRAAEIAELLGISVATVDAHRRNIKQKLGIHSAVELTRYAIRAGLTSA